MLLHNINIPAGPEEEVMAALAKRMRKERTPEGWQIVKKSLDARDKSRIRYVFSVETAPKSQRPSYQPPLYRGAPRDVVVVGAGPAGMLAALVLARAGLQPLLIEQGAPVEERKKQVDDFWQGGSLDPFSNVQFGEGGAGTFSDGKLASGIRDPEGRIAFLLTEMVKAGAEPAILYESKPHLGTDVLERVVQGLRRAILAAGGRISYNTRLKGLNVSGGQIRAIEAEDVKTRTAYKMPAGALVLALGHSARDSFRMLEAAGLAMEPKAFAMGLRIQHSQALIDRIQYGAEYDYLPPADYKLTAQTPEGRGVYSFCMCPGGYVVNAASEVGGLCVNGMSYSGRAGDFANSALAVQMGPADFGPGLFAGMEAQIRLEQAAYRLGEGAVPVQIWADFNAGCESRDLGGLIPALKGTCRPADLTTLSPIITESIRVAMPQFERKMPGFDCPEALLFGIESRTSSPLRILRNEDGQGSISGIFPCGEGAGYAGGITSAAVDGIRTAEHVIRQLEKKS